MNMPQGIKTDPDKVSAIREMVPPQNLNDVYRSHLVVPQICAKLCCHHSNLHLNAEKGFSGIGLPGIHTTPYATSRF